MKAVFGNIELNLAVNFSTSFFCVNMNNNLINML